MPKENLISPVNLDGVGKVEPNLLKDQVIELLRNQIVRGNLPPGTQLVERDLADQLGISRIPVRDALQELQKEGLLVTRLNRRYVIELDERDVRELYQTRLVLEKLAVELSAQNTRPENQQALLAIQREMKAAVDRKDARAYVQSDVDTHRLIWQQADNRHLLNTLNTMIGPIFMFVASNAESFDWNETVGLHEDLIAAINDGNAPAAVKSIEEHIESALTRSLKILDHLKGG
jgi:DNA-binding GntR family transcriptional regulator